MFAAFPLLALPVLVYNLVALTLQGGFGSAILELFCEEQINVPVKRVGLPDTFVEQGSQAELRARYGLDSKGIAAIVKRALDKD